MNALRILIVEDDVVMSKCVEEFLTLFGYQYETTESGEDAIALSEGANRPDLVLMDIHLAGPMDGITAGEEIHNRLHIPIVFITAHMEDETFRRAMHAEPFGFLLKPFSDSELKATIETALYKHRSVEALHQINLELEHRVARHTTQLEYANRELDAFTSSASHDLRAPLRSINGFGKILLADYGQTLDEGAKDLLQRIIAAGERMSSLIEALLEFSRVAHVEPHMRNVDISQMLSEIVDELAEQYPNHKPVLKIAANMSGFGDRNLLSVAFKNLLSNAFKFTSKTSEAVIEISSTILDGYTEFCVRDNGVGFDPTNADQLFEPFKRLHNRNEFPGTGIGLAIVQRIINRHGGHVTAEGNVNLGAVFSFTLPRPLHPPPQTHPGKP
ncbi:MAG: response regulator [Candidatus Riflebacteria bacterium]|nr:response regulator [Candidatus Riflebacteria bacterium]